MNFQEKECTECGTPFVGRSDKTFCSVACRVRAHRQRQSESEGEAYELEPDEDMPASDALLPWQEPISRPVIRLLPTPSPAPPVNVPIDPLANWRATCAAQEAERATKELQLQQLREAGQAKEAHQHYVSVVEPFLLYEGQDLTLADLREQLDLTIDAVEDYKKHPHLAQAGSVARQRLHDLRDIQKVLYDVCREAAGKVFSARIAYYEVPKKWRKQLRERLLE